LIDPSCARAKNYLIDDLTVGINLTLSTNSIFGYKLRTVEAENP